jgi:hypothetical protein
MKLSEWLRGPVPKSDPVIRLLNILALAVFLLAACTSTVTPGLVVPTHASNDGGEANSGLVMRLADGSFLVTDHFHDRYNGLIEIYGRQFVPEVKKDAGIARQGDDRWIIDAQHLDYFLKMNLWRKSAIPPKP